MPPRTNSHYNSSGPFEFLQHFKPRRNDFIAETGVTLAVFAYTYCEYCGPGTPISKPKYLFQFLRYSKLYPPISVRYRDSGVYGYRFNEMIKHLASTMDEVSRAWDSRREHVPNNSDFPPNVTSSLDTVPIFVNRASTDQHLFYHGKYKRHLYKIQLVCDHAGNVIWWTGPHLGTEADVNLWRELKPIDIMDSDERVFADKAYQNDGWRLAVPIKNHRIIE